MAGALAAPHSFGESQPNVIIVLVDDVGYGDLSCHGSPIIKTPRLDELHSQSVRLTDFHVSPMCTPTRSQLLSGRDALDNGAMNVSSGRSMLRRGIPTMADAFAAAGYRTGLFGKWHVGDVYPYRPQDHGFQRAVWFPSSHISSAPDRWNNDYFDPYFRLEDGRLQQFKGYCTDIQFDEAMDWIGENDEAQKPFFAFLALNAAHTPLFVPDKYREPFRQLDPQLASYYGMIVNIDENMGRLDAMLRRSGLRENTILIFMSDNGGTYGVATYNAGMKGGKISLTEGGHRVPCFVRWPAGKLGEPRDVDPLTHIQDWFPTLIEWCGVESPVDPKFHPLEFDGVSLAGLLSGDQPNLADRMLVVQFSRMNHAAPDKGDAVVMWNKWRLIGGAELYDVGGDLIQNHDVAEQHPDIVEKMRRYYDQWWADVAPQVNTLSNLTIGSPKAPRTLLSAADWQDVTLDRQYDVRIARERNGPWGLEVARDGVYAFELRRWPREADVALTAGVPAFEFVDGEYPPGKALLIAQAKLRVGDVEMTHDLSGEEKFVRFSVPLKAGPVQAQTWFYDASGAELCGAYYVYVERE